MKKADRPTDKSFAKKARALAINLKRFWKEPPNGKFLNLKEIFCLGSAGLGVSFITNLINMYVTVSQLPLIYDMGTKGTLHATVIYLTASVLGLILTPIYGKMIQKTKTRIGRYKPFILFLAPIVALLGVIAIWSPQSLDQSQRIIYVYTICIPTLLVWNLWFNTFNMFPGVFTPNQQERVDIWSPIGLVMGFAPTIMNALKGLFAQAWGDIIAARVFGLFSAIVGVICIIGLLKVKERAFITEEENKKEKVSVKQGLKMIVKNKPLMILTLALCLGALKGAIDLVWEIVGRVKYAPNMADAAAIFSGLSIIIGFAATPNMLLLPWLTRKFNNRTILIFWQALNTGAYLILALVGFQNLPQNGISVLVITALRFVACFNAIGSLQPLILSEIGDYQQWKTGYRLEGFVQTFAYSLTMVVTQFAMLVPAIIQDRMGFNVYNYQVKPPTGGIPANELAENVLSKDLIDIADRYANVAIWISVASGALMLICLFFYDLSKKKHAKIIEEIKENSVNTDEIESEKGDLVLTELDESEYCGNSDKANNAENQEINGDSDGTDGIDDTDSTVENTESSKSIEEIEIAKIVEDVSPDSEIDNGFGAKSQS